ncbi:hypothetical protein WLF14_14230 [Pseudomonas fluorescens]|uniref:hypothetical protein n=1 Tax=Pseudomonas fluorescens TaxID=294 RepID=UPI00313EE2C6
MQNYAKTALLAIGASGISGCAGIDLGEDGLTYFDPVPYILVTNNKDCSQGVTAVTLPGKQRSLKFKSGLGSAKLNVSLENGMIKTIGQETDTQIPQTIAALTPILPDKSTPKKCIQESTLIESRTLGFPFILPKPKPDNTPGV